MDYSVFSVAILSNWFKLVQTSLAHQLQKSTNTTQRSHQIRPCNTKVVSNIARWFAMHADSQSRKSFEACNQLRHSAMSIYQPIESWADNAFAIKRPHYQHRLAGTATYVHLRITCFIFRPRGGEVEERSAIELPDWLTMGLDAIDY